MKPGQRRVVVVGAGAAGTMAAIFAATSGAETLLLERTRDGGRKILISGGGRCNILPARVEESRFVTDSPPHLLRKMVRSWPLREQIVFFEREMGIPLVEEQESAKLFPASNRARDVRDGLLELAGRRGATVLTGTTVTDFTPIADGWRIEREGAPPLVADAVVVATGGLSVPSTGSDGLGLRVAGRLGHAVHPTYAALTPLTADPAPFASLAGVSVEVTLCARGSGREAAAAGGFLFTHKGYSGPAVLDISHVAVRSREGNGPRARLEVRWCRLDAREWEQALRPRGARTVAGALRAELPERLATALLVAAGVEPARPLADLRRAERLRLIDTLVRGDLPWTADEGYRKAEVTGGGVSLAEIDPRTLESRRHPGLFLCGEMLDAFGPIGGYNFLWAWATGRAAGLGAAGTDGFRTSRS
ncbi:MAG TPA: aminoacetone oxidase family FAD-binding enzyme [Candidatus Polarisedimenticolia bacterium]|nr:aminoacetone oxidase family FAD-binding enzyme [Candidatus Polarisedimenticolia bacterium]